MLGNARGRDGHLADQWCMNQVAVVDYAGDAFRVVLRHQDIRGIGVVVDDLPAQVSQKRQNMVRKMIDHGLDLAALAGVLDDVGIVAHVGKALEVRQQNMVGGGVTKAA